MGTVSSLQRTGKPEFDTNRSEIFFSARVIREVGLHQRGSDRVRLDGERGRLVAGSDQNGFVDGSTIGRTSTPPPEAGHSLPISTAWSRSRASTT